VAGTADGFGFYAGLSSMLAFSAIHLIPGALPSNLATLRREKTCCEHGPHRIRQRGIDAA
jgi:hypothetical protein